MRASALCLFALELALAQTDFQSNTRLVAVDVVVRDRDGKSVADLKTSDFQVLDNGKPVEVRVFTRSERGAEAKDRTELAQQVAQQLPPNTFSNIAAVEAMPRNATVILLDALNTPIEDQKFARQQVLNLLAELRADDQVAVYVLGARLYVLHDLSGDSKSLLSALEQYGGNPGANTSTESSVAPLMNNEKLDQMERNGQVFDIVMSQIAADQQVAVSRLEARVETTMAVLETIAQQLSVVQGRKNLLWVSAAFPFVVSTDLRQATGAPQTFEAAVNRAVRTLLNTGISVYPVDARGLIVDVMYRSSNTHNQQLMGRAVAMSKSRGGRRGPRGTFTSADPMVYADRDETVSHHDVMRDLAQRTGGKAFVDTNGIQKALREAMDDVPDSYVLGFYSSADDGRFHKLQVKVARQGVAVRHREGYFASDFKARPDDGVWDMVAAPVEMGAIPVAALCVPEDGGNLRVELKVDASALTLQAAEGRWRGKVDVYLLFLDARGWRKAGMTQDLNLDLAAAEREAALAGGLNHSMVVKRPEGAVRLVIGIRGRADGRLGTVRVKLP